MVTYGLLCYIGWGLSVVRESKRQNPSNFLNKVGDAAADAQRHTTHGAGTCLTDEARLCLKEFGWNGRD